MSDLRSVLRDLRASLTEGARLSLPASFLIDQGWEFGNSEWRARDKLTRKEKLGWAETQRSKLGVPIDVTISRDGRVDFLDGHHRVYAADALGTNVLVTVTRNRMPPQVWPEYLDRISKGFTYREINPDGDALTKVPSIAALKAGRRSGLRDSSLREFYDTFDEKIQ